MKSQICEVGDKLLEDLSLVLVTQALRSSSSDSSKDKSWCLKDAKGKIYKMIERSCKSMITSLQTNLRVQRKDVRTPLVPRCQCESRVIVATGRSEVVVHAKGGVNQCSWNPS